MNNSKHDAVWSWLQTCPKIADLYFNFGETANGVTVVAPVSAIKETLVEEYIDGTALRWYDFALLRFSTYSSDPNAEENIDDLEDVGEIAAWIEAQEDTGNYPTFVDEPVQRLEVLPDAGYLASVDENGAKYMIQIRIEYLAKR